MLAVSLPDDAWAEIESAVAPTLEEIDAQQARFSGAERRLREASTKLLEAGRVRPGPVLKLGPFGSLGGPSPVEALSHFGRHANVSTTDNFDAIARIVDEPPPARLTPQVLMDWHRALIGDATGYAGVWKATENILPRFGGDGVWQGHGDTVPAAQVPEEVDRLCRGYEAVRERSDRSAIVCIAALAWDLFTIHPFADGNGRTTRVAMRVQLIREGHLVARLPGLEEFVARRRWRYLRSLSSMSANTPLTATRVIDWTRFVADAVRTLYAEADERADRLEAWVDRLGV